MKRMMVKAKMNVINFNFGTGHYIVAEKNGKYSFYKAPCVLSVHATRRIVESLINDMEDSNTVKRYQFETTKAGTRMDDSPLFKLVVKDFNSPDANWMHLTVYDDLTEWEVEQTLTYFADVELGVSM